MSKSNTWGVEMKRITDPWFTVNEIDAATFAISEHGHTENVHSFLLLGTAQAALIDTGLGIDNIKKVVDHITRLPIVVLTTHVHWDHIGSHGEFENIYVHKNEEDWLRNGIKGLPVDLIRKEVAGGITRPVPETFDPSLYTPFQGNPKGLLHDGDIIDLGNRELEIIHTPGHSPGHVCIYDHVNEYLFSGDLLYEGIIYAFYPTTDPIHLVASLEKITHLNRVRKIYGSHNRLGLESGTFLEVDRAVRYLKKNNLVRHGTGIHHFATFGFQF